MSSSRSSPELDAWAERIRGWLDGSSAPDGMPRDTYVYFDNDARGRAPWDAVSLAERLR
ncbi:MULTISPECIES: DUF72 domain-containing protein [Microbacterium]|uniref:DUF72 domain-containing protein n=1 Tax=Microbacterium TaxID=33882 RepID=UPI0027825FFB|nr:MULTISPECIES: DUF72 domain-containing protein [Microbacterium]MDQ1083059.1 uncharacterized protein YecE (DUF72 family) [Microbacterium sp. SORGH_AS_0344]MDQ1171669.1 uncharacterized protein YecE (DUF72 family) [Microbacterium proteolyticum]